MTWTQAQPRSHVPKFGNWDNDNIPYTAFFDNARKDKGGVMINPNDPQQNPEAFRHEITEVELSFGETQSACNSVSEADGQRMPINNAHRRIPFESAQQKMSSRHNNNKSITSESGSDKSSSDYSLLQAAYRRDKSDRKNKRMAGEEPNYNTLLSTSTSVVSQRTQIHPSNNQRHRRTSSVPKFGAWDEADPTSGEGFTVIFNRVKEEKQLASAAFPNNHQKLQPTYYFVDPPIDQAGSNSSRSKFWCCLCSCGSK